MKKNKLPILFISDEVPEYLKEWIISTFEKDFMKIKMITPPENPEEDEDIEGGTNLLKGEVGLICFSSARSDTDPDNYLNLRIVEQVTSSNILHSTSPLSNKNDSAGPIDEEDNEHTPYKNIERIFRINLEECKKILYSN